MAVAHGRHCHHVKEDITQSGGRFAAILKNVSKTYHQVGRPLATADEIMRLKAPVKDRGDIITEPGDMLVFVAGHAPIFGTQSSTSGTPFSLPAPTCRRLRATARSARRPSALQIMTASAGRKFALGAWLGIGLFAALVLWACMPRVFASTKARPFLSGFGISHPCGTKSAETTSSASALPTHGFFAKHGCAAILVAGLCEGGYEPLLKPIAAIEGDRVTRTDQGIRINGRLIANSKNIASDGSGRPLPSNRANDVIVAKGDVWVISSYNPSSFDSRYFGPVPTSKIEGLANPLFVMGPRRHP